MLPEGGGDRWEAPRAVLLGPTESNMERLFSLNVVRYIKMMPATLNHKHRSSRERLWDTEFLSNLVFKVLCPLSKRLNISGT